MKQVIIRKGVASTSEVPAPQMTPGEVLVRVHASCLSTGTELSGLRGSAVPLWKKVVAQPAKAAKVLKTATEQGLNSTRRLIMDKMGGSHPTGYSAAGAIIACSPEVRDLAIGDRVACAGAQYAYHAEYIRVPRNLCVPVPEELDFESASTVTLGAISLQGVRRAQPTLGEAFVVVGLGVLGQITVQILRANGCKVVGVDLDHDRVALALSLGMEYGHHTQDADFDTIARLTDGQGADGVIITAATPSDEVVASAFQMSRKKGRVVLVGDVGLNLNRNDFYSKEIDFLISTSYGPGRYDERYEEGGLDYPIGYVRWTENRNMREYLRLLAIGRVQIAPLIAARFAISQAHTAYDAIKSHERPLLVMLTYPLNDGVHREDTPDRRVTLNTKTLRSNGRIRLAVIGAGSFARTVHFPNLQSLNNQFALRAVVCRTGHSAKAMGEQYRADYVSTDPQEVFTDPDIDAVLIATRHHLHGSLALAALKAGKHVLVEKPLTLHPDELTDLKSFYSGVSGMPHHGGNPILLTGYNRRFSSYALRMKGLVASRSAPFIINYRMNAGYIPRDHWVHTSEGGGRNLGEACHIYDLFTFLTDSEVVAISAQAIKPRTAHYGRNDNFVTTLSFADGSVATLTYTSLGHKDHPKETAELYVDGKLAILDDYRSLSCHGAKSVSLKTRGQDKGLLNELQSFATSIKSGEWPIPWWQQVQVAEIGFVVEEQIHAT